MASINNLEEKVKSESLKFSLLMTEKSTHDIPLQREVLSKNTATFDNEIFLDPLSDIITLDQKKRVQRKMTWHPQRNKTIVSEIRGPQLFKFKSFDENREY